MQEGYEEFKLKVLQKVTTFYLEQQDCSPVFCFQGKEGQNKLLQLPKEIFFNSNYKEYLPDIIKGVLEQTKSKYFCLIMECTITHFERKDKYKKLEETPMGKTLADKLKYYEVSGKEPSFTKEEHSFLTKELGEDRIVFLFQAKEEEDSFLSFIKEEKGKLKPSLSFDGSSDSPMSGLFGNMYK